MRLGVIILAGGGARRFGSNKLLARLSGGQAMLDRAIEQCKPLTEQISIVTGAYHGAIAEHLGPDCDIVFNSKWQEGLSGSLHVGLAHVKQQYPGTTHLLVMLGDLPLVTTQSLSVLVEVATIKPDMMVASFWDGRCTAPAIFPQQYWAALERADGDKGAGGVLNQGLYAAAEQTIAVPHPEAAYDIDTVRALKNIR